ncbi:hypothetical protein, partial [Fluviibacter phosphoraccumulans]|uniref:hypothetical protein n=1 Tax=Fluviibacter phosphoraccumulans TaxID=1751046 RepID=UPI0024E1A4F6
CSVRVVAFPVAICASFYVQGLDVGAGAGAFVGATSVAHRALNHRQAVDRSPWATEVAPTKAQPLQPPQRFRW